jgi:hypothetical protein
MMKLKMTLAVAALLIIGLSSVAAYADTLNFTLTNPVQNMGTSGGLLTFAATVSAPSTNGAAVFLNGDSFNSPSPITLDDSDFLLGFPLSLAPGASFTGDLFVLTVPANIPLGIYVGDFTLQGGANGGSSDNLGTVAFTVNEVPEPSSIVLLLTGVAGLARFKGGLRGWAR